MDTLRRAVEQAEKHGLIPPPQLGALRSAFERWEAEGRARHDPAAWLSGLGLAPAEVEQLLTWRAAASSDSAKYSAGSTLARYLRAGPLGKKSRLQGTRVGPYVVERELARGGMGVVFVAQHERTGQTVALKTMILGTGASKEAKQRFSREAETAARLDHPGLVKVLGAGEEEGLAWLALEFIEGTTLETSIKTLGTRQLIKLLLATARALEHAHAEGVVHRDIKPQNILVEASNDRVVVTDFGLVKDLEGSSDLTKTGQALGTPYYMAPEQVVGEPPTPATDVYALGVILYEILAGQLPFSGEMGLALFAAIRNDPPTPLKTLNPDVSPGLASICRLAMAKSPVDRYPDAGALADDLEAWLSGRTGGVERDRGPLVPLLVAGVLVLVALLGLLMRRGGEPDAAVGGASVSSRPDPASSPSNQPSPTTGPLPKPPPGPDPVRPTPTPTRTGGAGVDRAEALRRADELLATLRGRTAATDADLATADRAVAAAPFHGKARFYRGRILAAQKKKQRAIADLRAADKVSLPFSGPALYDLRWKLLYEARAFAEALPDLERAIRRRPRDGQLAFSRALCLRAARRTDEAITAFEQILRVEGSRASWQVLYNLAGSYKEAERWTEAEAAYRKVIAVTDYVHAYRHLGEVLRKSGRPEEADALFSKAAGRHGRDFNYLIQWTHARLAMKRWRGAETLARKVIALKPTAGGYLVLARSLQGQGRRAEAIQALEGCPPQFRGNQAIQGLLKELGGS